MHLDALKPGNASGRIFAGWADLVSSDILEQYAMDAPVPAPPSRQSLPLRQPPGSTAPEAAGQTLEFLCHAADLNGMEEPRMSALIVHEGIVLHLRAAAEDRPEVHSFTMTVHLLDVISKISHGFVLIF